MDPTDVIFFTAEALERASSVFDAGRVGWKGARGGLPLKADEGSRAGSEGAREGGRRNGLEGDGLSDGEYEAGLSDMLLSDMDSGIFFNEANAALFAGAGDGGLSKQASLEGDGLRDPQHFDLEQQQEAREGAEEYPSALQPFPAASLSSKNVSSLPSGVHGSWPSFMGAGPPVWKQPGEGMSHQDQKGARDLRPLVGQSATASQDGNALGTGGPGLGAPRGEGRQVMAVTPGQGEGVSGLMDETASVLSSECSSLWGTEEGEGGRAGGRLQDNSMHLRYQMRSVASPALLCPSPGSSSNSHASSGGMGGGEGKEGRGSGGKKGGRKGTAGGRRRAGCAGGGGSCSSADSGNGRECPEGSTPMTEGLVDTMGLEGFFSSGAGGGGGGGRGAGAMSVKRKQDRNAREQKRSLKISQQIGHLKSLLEEEGRKVKKNSKMAILLSVEDYIKELEEEVGGMVLGREGGREEGEGVKEGMDVGVGTSVEAAGQRNGRSESDLSVATATSVREDREVARGVGYHSLFKQVSTPLAVASVEGRFIDANVRFEMATGYTKAELGRLTFFNLVAPEELQDTFAAVARMLNQPSGGEEEKEDSKMLRLTRRALPKVGIGGLGQEAQNLHITISLVKPQEDSMAFFQCSLD